MLNEGRMVAGTEDFGYVNARIKAMRSALLGPSDYENLIASPDFSTAIELLKNTVYGDLATSGPSSGSIDPWEEKLIREWSHTLQKLFLFTGGRPRNYLEVLIGWIEAESLKTVLRGKHANLESGDILRMVLPAGFFNEGVLSELARQPHLQAVIDLLATWGSHYAKPLKKILKPGWELKGLVTVERTIENQFFRYSQEKLKGTGEENALVRHWLGWTIDRINILTSFKISRERLEGFQDLRGFFIEGGKHISFSVFSDLASAGNLEAQAESIQRTPYAPVAAFFEAEEGKIPLSLRLERGLEGFILNEMGKAAFSDPLGIGVLMEFLFRKHHEICNIRILLRGKAYGLYPEDIRSLWIVKKYENPYGRKDMTG